MRILRNKYRLNMILSRENGKYIRTDSLEIFDSGHKLVCDAPESPLQGCSYSTELRGVCEGIEGIEFQVFAAETTKLVLFCVIVMF